MNSQEFSVVKDEEYSGVEVREPGRFRAPGHPAAARVCDGILSAVGNTPLIRLRRLLPEARFELFAKLEALNPGGSMKDRPALAILEEALRSGEIGPGTVVIESSSGNMGVG